MTTVDQGATAKGTLSPIEMQLLHENAKRAHSIFERWCPLPNVPKMWELEAELTIVHETRGLRLGELFAADEFNFMHDICGIRVHLDRITGKLKDCFVPRFAK